MKFNIKQKARVMLIAIMLSAVIGGALAYNARQINIFYSASTPLGACTIRVSLTFCITITVGITTRLSTAPTTAPCPTIRVTICL
ncbi:hypothetical protein [Chitinophaga niastensis]|uniref:hypothetical protein n=1 Tax=Chitinophaga niastensis TaxID=536980 RepID=UPI0011B240EF|nr:hypothetical protein [Chitinophaga niastensis]